MPPDPQNPKRIRTVNEFLDTVIEEANKHLDHKTEEFMRMLHTRIIRTARKDNELVEDGVLKAYFRMYVLLNNEVVSRTRIIATAEAVVGWLRN